MNQRRWEQIDVVLQQALEVEKGERAPFLDKVCAGDAELRREVEDLLSREVDTGEFLKNSPPAGVAGKATRQPDALRAGEQISHYRIRARIGRGGMGEVYLALDERLQRLVAIKTLPAEFTADAERVRRLEQEAIAASRLNHPNIITIFEIVQTDRAYFIATEYVEGQTLRRMLTNPETKQSQRIGVEQALEIAIQIASALKAAHTAWII
ncbi:MAG: serine/threonine-protein kinase, partial [Blastocatellia bacterium]